MSFAATLEAVESQIRDSDLRIGAQLSNLSGVLQRLSSVTQRHALNLHGLQEDLASLQVRFEEKKLVIVVCGATSAGKSTLINALLRRDVIFTAPEHCTPCSVSVESIPSATKKREFFTQGKWSPGCKEMDITQLASFSDAKSTSASRQPLFVYLQHDGNQENLMRLDNLRLVDSPGLYENVDESCVDLEGDAFAFVVDFDVGVQWEELQKKLQSRSDKAVFFVFNRCDAVDHLNASRFEQGKKEKLDRAVDFLMTNNVFRNVDNAANSVFFLSASLAFLQRKNNAAVQELKAAIIHSCGKLQDPQVLICGCEEAGKTTLCNDLVGCDLLPSNESRCFVRLQKDHGSGPLTDLQQLRNDIEARLQDHPDSDDILRVNVTQSLLSPQSLLSHGVAVVDSPSEDFPPDCKSTAAIFVVSGAMKFEKLKRSAERFVERCAACNVVARYLVVTKMNDLVRAKGGEHARCAAADIRQLWPSEATEVIFLEKEALMDKYGSAFDVFEQQLVEAGHQRFTDVKLRRIEEAASSLTSRLDVALRGALTELEAMEAAFRAAPQTLLDSANATVLSSTRVDRFLREQELPRDAVDLPGFASQFRVFLRDDLTQQLRLTIEAPLRVLGQVDERAQDAGRAVLEEGIAAMSIEEVGAVLSLEESLPPPREALESSEERKRSLAAQREELSQSCAALKVRRARAVTRQENAQRLRRQREAELAAIAERTAANAELLEARRQERAAALEAVESARRGCEEAEAAAETARIAADKAAAEAVAAEAVIRALTETIHSMDKPINYILNPLGTAIRCPQERRRRSHKEHERDAHRKKEQELRNCLNQHRSKLQQLCADKEAKERTLNEIDQQVGLTSAFMEEAASKTATEERLKMEVMEEEREVSEELLTIDEELEEAETAAQEVEKVLQEETKKQEKLLQEWEAKTEELPTAVREQLDQVSFREGEKFVQALKEALQRFADTEVAELRREKTEMEVSRNGVE